LVREQTLKSGIDERDRRLPYRRYRDRTPKEIRIIARHYLAVSITSFSIAAALFGLGALSLVPGFSPLENVILTLAALILGVVGIMAATVWTNMDRWLHHEPIVDPEWEHWMYRGGGWRLVLVIFIFFMAMGVILHYIAPFLPERSMGNMIALAAILVLILLVLLVLAYLKRRRILHR